MQYNFGFYLSLETNLLSACGFEYLNLVSDEGAFAYAFTNEKPASNFNTDQCVQPSLLKSRKKINRLAIYASKILFELRSEKLANSERF